MIYPCASVLSVFHFRPVDIAEGWWTPLLTDIFIQCCSWIYSFRVSHGYIHSVFLMDVFIPCCRCVPSLRRGHKSKKETRISQTLHGLVFHGSFFLIIFGSVILGFCYGFIWICECWHTPFPGVLSSDLIFKTWLNPCMLLRALRLDSCHTGRPYESKLSTVYLHDRNRWRLCHHLAKEYKR